MRVVVVLAYRLDQVELVLEMSADALVSDALEKASGMNPAILAALDAGCDVGVWGKSVRRDVALSDGDRVELYRPLTADPKETRRRRARKKSARA